MLVIQKLFQILSCLVVSSGAATEAAGSGGEEDRGWNRVEEVQDDQLNMAMFNQSPYCGGGVANMTDQINKTGNHPEW